MFCNHNGTTRAKRCEWLLCALGRGGLMSTYHKIVLLAQLGLHKGIQQTKDGQLVRKTTTTRQSLQQDAATHLPEPVLDNEGQTAAHDGVRVLLGLLRDVARHAL